MIEQLCRKYRWKCGLTEVAKWEEQGGQTGGREREGYCDQVCERIFFEVAKIFNSRLAYSIFFKAFATKKNDGRENDSQSWNPCFLGVRSPVWLFKSGGDPV